MRNGDHFLKLISQEGSNLPLEERMEVCTRLSGDKDVVGNEKVLTNPNDIKNLAAMDSDPLVNGGLSMERMKEVANQLNDLIGMMNKDNSSS